MYNILVIVFSLIVYVPISYAATYYVAKTGSNNNSCSQAQSPSSPKLTIAAGIGCLNGGDTLRIGAGSYSESINAGSIPSGGSWSNTTKIVGAGASSGTRLVVGGDNTGIYASSGFSYIEFFDLEIDGSNNTGHDGIKFDTSGVSHVRFTRVRTHHFRNQGVLMTKEGNNDIQFLQHESHHNGTGGSCYEHNRCHGMYITADNLLIDGAILHDNESNGIQIYPGPGANPIMRNSLVYNNPNWGLFVSGSFTNGKIYNNTITGNGQNYALTYDASGCQVRNNIVYNNTQAIRTGCSQSNNFTSNPNFVSAGANDFRLQANSQAINAGANVGSDVPTDKDGVSRPQGGAYDIGAYEYVSGGGGAQPPFAPSNLQVTGN